jgi:2-dehydro-3-deoxyphosphogluconate aldolase / (4S)-4-hydroxy-2-oxoglutarate aldolase
MTMTHSGAIEKFLRLSPVMPVVTFTDPAVAVDVARALVRGGIRVIEVTLRTPVALKAMELIAKSVPEITVGAGTVLTMADLKASAEAGAAFAISPGATDILLNAGTSGPIPYLPAVATASELMAGLAAGYQCFKFFPAGAAGKNLKH